MLLVIICSYVKEFRGNMYKSFQASKKALSLAQNIF